YGPPPCRSAASCVPAVRSPPPSRRAWWCVSRASCAIRSCIPTGPRTWSWPARCCAGRSWRCSAGTTRRSIPPPWPGSRRPGSASSWPGARPRCSPASPRCRSSMLARMAEGVARQVLYDATALGPLCAIPFLLGVGAARETRGPLAVAAWFTALPLALNPSPRYAVPLVPLLLPATAAGLLALGERLGRHARVATAALGVALVVQALWVSHPFDAACSREVSRLVLERYGPGQALVAVDGRFAYGARGRALVPPTTDPDDALAPARRSGARPWLTRPA